MNFYKGFTGSALSASAHFLGQRIRVKEIPNLVTTPLRSYILQPSTGGIIHIFRYGAVVLFGISEDTEKEVLEKYIRPHLVSPFDYVETERVSLLIRPMEADNIIFEHITLQSMTPERLDIVGNILAKSAVLSHYERKATEVFDILDPAANTLQAGLYPTARRARMFLQHIGLALAIQRNMVGQVEMTDKPESLWEQPPEMHRFYAWMEDEFEILERYATLQEKLSVIHRTAETMVDLLQARQSLRVEWYIVLLIVFEVCITVGEKTAAVLKGQPLF